MKVMLAALFAAAVSAAPREKRSFGGAPCVVTGDELYINGLYQRNLTSSEQQELTQYQNSLTQYENALQAAIDQRRQDRINGRNGGMRGGSQNQTAIPDPPSRPSFCSDSAITQYIFDGCMVQDNKVYVGKQYARDLTASEQQQLQDFDAQMQSYQDYLASQLQSQVNSLFGQGFLSQFMNGGSTTMPSTTGATSSPGPAPQPPTAPNFCTAIY